MQTFSIPIDLNDTVQIFRFYLDEKEYYIWSEGLELAMDHNLNIFYCDMPLHWKAKAMKTLSLLLKINK